MKIIDCHVHTQPLADYRSAAERLLKHMYLHRIEQVIISDLGGSSWVAFPDSKTLQDANDRLQKFCQSTNGAASYLVYLNPQLDDWHDEFKRHCQTAVGVKLWVSLRRENDSSLARSIEVLKCAAQYELPVLIHTFDRTDGLTAGSVGINEIIELARAVPECRIVAAHACGRWRKAIKRAAEFPENIAFDVSGYYPERGMVQRFVAAFGSKRVLYGSDAPGRSFGSQLQKVFEADLSDEERSDILYNNAKRIFKLSENVPNVAAEPLPRRELADLQTDHFCFCGEAPWFDHIVSVDELAGVLNENNVKHAYTASLEAASNPDKISANKKFVDASRIYKNIHPLAAVDLSDMLQAVNQLENMAGFAGIWLSPYLHGYKLDAPEYRSFFELCAQRHYPIWINISLSDDRFRCRDLKSRCVADPEIINFALSAPENQYILQGVNNHIYWDKVLPENFLLEYSRLSDGEYLAGDYNGRKKRLVRGSEYPFRSYNAVDNVLLGKL